MQFNDLQKQYTLIQEEANEAVHRVMASGRYIGGNEVEAFSLELATKLGVKHVIPCGNGTDALQIALMAIGLQAGDEVIVPAFTYAATAEAVAILGGIPVFVDVDERTFNITPQVIEQAITPRTRAVIPVHLFGRKAPMQDIEKICKTHSLYCIEDNAQSLAPYSTLHYPSHTQYETPHNSHFPLHVACTSFFPTKNLACMGDGGAIYTNDDILAQRARQIAQHGQVKRYTHEIIGLNSRLDAIQAAILRIRLRHLDEYIAMRRTIAARYTTALTDWAKENGILLPSDSTIPCADNVHTAFSHTVPSCTDTPYTNDSIHTYNQYTLRVPGKSTNTTNSQAHRDSLATHLQSQGIPTMIYYPIPLHHQPAFTQFANLQRSLSTSERLCTEVISLPIYPGMSTIDQDRIIQSLHSFINRH